MEEVRDEEGRWLYVFHTLLGRRANEVLARAFGRAVTKRRRTNVALQVSDNGFVLVVPPFGRLAESEVTALFFLPLGEELRAALEGTEILRRRFRHVAARAFLILRRYLGRRASTGRDQVNAQALLKALTHLAPDSPVLRETYREIFEEAFDVPRAVVAAERVVWEETKVRYLANRTVPSPFAFGLVTSGRSDALLMEDKKEMIRNLHARVMALLEGEPKPEEPKGWEERGHA